MEIIIASHSGLCYGVKRALTLAKQTRRRRSGRVLTLGELIHNPRVIADLEALGLESVDDPAAVGEGTVVIRSHGVAPAVYRALKKKGIEVVDATCPIVKRIQQLVEGLARRQADIVIVGDPAHPEIRGLLGYSRGRGRIVENEAQARSLPRRQHRAVLAQSTQDALLFGRVVAALLERTDKLEVYNTICRSTQTRQKSTSDLAGPGGRPVHRRRPEQLQHPQALRDLEADPAPHLFHRERRPDHPTPAQASGGHRHLRGSVHSPRSHRRSRGQNQK